jgi:putative methyltransferase (TIGR04325 family)
MINIVGSLARSRGFRTFIMNLEERVPFVRAWHRFEYQRHFAEESPAARMFAGVYQGFEAALEAIPKGARIGHDHAEVADRHTSEIGHVWPSDYPTLFWLATLMKQDMCIFDLGGSTGLLYYSFKKYLVYPVGVSWVVCEVPAVARRGADLARERHTSNLSFTSRIEDAEGADILLCSGVLQFMERPLWLWLTKMKVKPQRLLINRTPLTDGAGFTTLQNIGRSICPYQIWNRKEFIRNFERIGFELVDCWETPEFSCYIPFHPEESVRAYSGMCLRLARPRCA